MPGSAPTPPRRTGTAVVLALLLAAATGTSALAVPPAALPSSDGVEPAIARIRPAVVRIHAVSVRYQGGREVKYESVGSGSIITTEGHIVTNHHVAGNAQRITCTLSSREDVEADLVSTDPLTDIAVIKLRNPDRKEFPTAVFGDSGRVAVGDPVLAVGSPFALSQTVTRGIVSNTEIILPKFFGPANRLMLDGEDVGSIVRWIGHDAPIYGGNSGGPLVGMDGKILGINEVALGISGAIPGNLAKEIADRLIRSGTVARSWVGLDIQPLLGGSGPHGGALVSGTVDGSPAEKAGFLPGDILLAVDSRAVSVRFDEEIPIFNKRIMDLPVGKTVEAVVLRQGRETTLRMVTAEREAARAKTSEFKLWGMTARNLSRIGAKEMKRDSADGVLVTTVRPGGPCWEAKPKITDGDVIVEVGGRAVRNVADLAEATRALRKGKSDPVHAVVAFDRKKERRLTMIRLEEEPETRDRGLEARKAWISVITQVLNRDIARETGIPGGTGLRITLVYPGRIAEKAGLRVGDVITGIEGERVRTSSSEENDILPGLVGSYRIGSTVRLSVRRGKETLEIPVELERSLPPPGEMKRYSDNRIEMSVRDIASVERVLEGWGEGRSGVLVDAVGEGGWAALGKLSVGDIIESVDGEAVPDVEAFGKTIRKVRERKPECIVFKVRRGIHTVFVEIRPNGNGTF